MPGLTQKTSNLSERQVMALMANRGLAANGTEYCPEALLSRLVVLKERKAAKYTASCEAAIAEMNANITFPPPVKPVAKPVDKSFKLVNHNFARENAVVFAKSKIKFEIRY